MPAYYIVMQYREVKFLNKEPTNRWCIEFGDYNREIAAQELKDLKYEAKHGTKRNFKLYKVPDAKQSSIDAFIKNLNTKET